MSSKPTPLAVAQHKLEEAARLQKEATKIIQDELHKTKPFTVYKARNVGMSTDCLLGVDMGIPGRDRTVKVYGKRLPNGRTEITRIEGVTIPL